ncbi:hypothetical protein [Corallococcus exiguus]|uniref:hypothetical protein n=1 Tax=Corallococcus exiguus TaxID=83462 RepID=UPI0014942BB7|nr:hypothetical protein [Corallococcus exiguus]
MQHTDGRVAFYVAHARRNASLESMVRAAGSRWAVEEDFESAKNEVGLTDYEVRTWTAWYRHMTLCLVAHVLLAAARVVAKQQLHEGLPPKNIRPAEAQKPHARVSRPARPTLSAFVSYSVQEVQALLVALLRRMTAPFVPALAWSHWRRHHQAVAHAVPLPGPKGAVQTAAVG